MFVNAPRSERQRGSSYIVKCVFYVRIKFVCAGVCACRLLAQCDVLYVALDAFLEFFPNLLAFWPRERPMVTRFLRVAVSFWKLVCVANKD